MKFKEQAQVIDDSVVVPITTDNKVDRLMASEHSQSIDSIVVNESEQEMASTHEKDQSSSAPSSSSNIRNDTTPPVLSPSSNATLKLTKELLFPEGTKAISDHCSFDPALSLIQDKEDDD